jgi:uncharacterized membrane protein YgaE (UPF0421/DUF939 family)
MHEFVSTKTRESMSPLIRNARDLFGKFLDFIDVSEREATDAARLALQSALAAASIFLLMQSAGLPEKFVGILSAVLVVQPSAGNTLGEARDRVLATVVGSLIGLVSLLLLPIGYGTAFALALSMLIMNAIAGLRPDWRYGVVAAVALSLGSESDALQTVQDRTVAIGIGAFIGAIISLVVLPDTSRKRAQRHLQAALDAAARSLGNAVDKADGKPASDNDGYADRYHSNIKSARKAADGVRFGDREVIHKRIEIIEELYNSILILNRVADQTNGISEGNDSFQDNIKLIRKQGCEVIKAIADGDVYQAEKLDEVWESVKSARRQVSGSKGNARDHVIRSALVFGFGEVAESLKKLIDIHKDERSADESNGLLSFNFR